MRSIWSPMREMMQLHARLGRALGDPLVRGWGARRRRQPMMPPLDVAETKDAFLVRLDVPGLRRDELEITVDEGHLQIAGEAPGPGRGDGQVVRRSERFHGPFRRVVPMPRQADGDSVEASLSDGVLTVTVNKRVPDGGRKVEIS